MGYELKRNNRMKLKNLQRAGELAEDYATLKKVRELLSEENVIVSVSGDIDRVVLPLAMKYNVLQIVNIEINKIEKEVGEL